MKKLLTIFAVMALASTAFGQLVITGTYDGPLPGGLPKGVELCAVMDIADLSAYGLGSANNGGGTDGEEWTFPADSAVQGQFIYVATEDVEFANFFGFVPDYFETGYALSINGDDAVELFHNGMVVDTFGDINMDGTGQPWEHLDSWAYRVDNTPDGPWDLSFWFFGGPNVWDGELTNDTAAVPMPIGTYWFDPAVAAQSSTLSSVKSLFE